MKTITYTKKDFAWVKWSEADIKRVAKEIVVEKKDRYKKIKKIPASDRTFENTIYALESSDYCLSDKAGFIGLLMQVHVDARIRKTAKLALEQLEKQMVDIEYDEGVYKAVLEYAEKKEKLTGDSKKLFDDMLLGYKRMGFGLTATKRKKLQENAKKMSKISSAFSYNINEYQDYILLTEGELAGLPENYVRGLQKDKKSGKYKVTLEYPDIGPFMSKAENAEKRKELSEKSLQKGGKENLELLGEMVKLRAENAKLLGYKTHVDYKTETRTVKTSARAFSFVNDLMRKIKKGSDADLKELLELKREQTGDKIAVLHGYDIAYYADQLQQKRFSIDSEKVREYFPIEIVKKGTFTIYEKLLSVKFEKVSGIALWHKDVEMYAIKDKAKTGGGEVISYFMLDLYPREGKYGHACAVDMVDGRFDTETGKYVAPVSVMIANFPKPQKKSPSLLSHGEVETFFHEFGHIMHMTMTRARYMSQSGASVAWDFVEAPSQMLEHWVWDKKMLKILSKHYKAGKNLPKVMLGNMLKGKMHMTAYGSMRQMTLALFDLRLHTEKIKSSPKLYAEIVKKFTGIVQPKSQIFPAGFGHMMGYDAGYYGYMWSKVFADDMFTRFKHAGLLNKKVGMEYRKTILEKGSSEEEMKLLERFLGRKPNNRAFLKELGL